jgi:hypothetical protein
MKNDTKPYKIKNNIIFPSTTSNDFEFFSCRDSINGVCKYDISLNECIDKNIDMSLFLDFKDNNKSICMNFDKYHKNINLVETLVDSNSYNILNDIDTYTILKDNYEYPPNISNIVFYDDKLTLKENNLNNTIGKFKQAVINNNNILFDDSIDIIIRPITNIVVNYKITNFRPLRFGEQINFIHDKSILIFDTNLYNKLIWSNISNYSSNNFPIILKSNNGKNNGDIITYSDTFEMYYNNIPIVINDKGELVLKDKNKSFFNNFQFKSESIGYYCNNDNIVSSVYLDEISRDGYKGYYNNKPVFREYFKQYVCDNHDIEVYPVVNNNIQKYNHQQIINNNTNNIFMIIIKISLLIIVILFVLILKKII